MRSSSDKIKTTRQHKECKIQPSTDVENLEDLENIHVLIIIMIVEINQE